MEGVVTDRRKHKRLPVRTVAFCKKVGSSSDCAFGGNTVNICPEGLLVEIGDDFATDAGDLFTVELEIPDADAADRFGGKVSAYARVVRIVEALPQQRAAKKHIAFQFCSRPRFDI